MNLYLIGYRGTGKSSLAPRLAQRLGPPYKAIDMDRQIETRAGGSIAEIFASQGESGFRELESRLLQELDRQQHLVVATGGGIVVRPEHTPILRRGFVVWLTAAPAILWRRMTSDPTTTASRPNLTPHGGAGEIETVLAARRPLYDGAAHFRLATDDADLESLVDAIVAGFEHHQGAHAG